MYVVSKVHDFSGNQYIVPMKDKNHFSFMYNA